MTASSPGDSAGLSGSLSTAAAAAAVHLSNLTPSLDLWMITQVDGSDQRVLHAEGRWARRMKTGRNLPWATSLCLRMVESDAPALIADINDVPAFQAAAVGPHARVRAYAGAPIILGDGELFGTVCGFNGRPVPFVDLENVQPSLELAAQMLGAVATSATAARAAEDLLEHAAAASDRDAETGVRNRRGFDEMAALEEARCHLFGIHSSIVLIQVTGEPPGVPSTAVRYLRAVAPEDVARACVEVLGRACPPCDVIARLDHNTFAVLAPETDVVAGQALKVRLRKAMREAGLFVRTGSATRWPDEPMQETLQRAATMLQFDRRRPPFRAVPPA